MQPRFTAERVTVARRAMLRVLCEAPIPVTAVHLLRALAERGVVVNKSTVYRELQFFQKKGIARAIQFDERTKRYERTPDAHKHHLICTECKKIEDVVLDHDLDQVERRLTHEKKFKLQRHALEFYGVCGECQG